MRRTRSSGRSARPADPLDPTTSWARDAVDGRIVVGELVRHAAERHLRDLRDGPARGLHFRPERAARILAFLPAVFSVTAGSAAGQPFHPLPWHVFVLGSLFGWVLPSGRLRFRAGWLETGKGQAKSPVMAAVGLYMMGWHGVARAEVYAIGQDRATANVLFRDAVAMCRADIPGGDEGESLEHRAGGDSEGDVVIRGEGDNAWKIEHPETGSKFQTLANNQNVSGPRPVAVLADEIHEFASTHAIETWQRAIAKMPGDALMLLGTNTPAANQLVGTAYSEFYQRVAKGEFTDDEAFAFIARIDRADWETAFDNEACWPKALPALGTTFPVENIRGEINTARGMISRALSVQRLYLGIPVGAAGFWIAEHAWTAVQGRVDVEALKGRPCWLSLDLSQKNDLTALSACWQMEDGHLVVRTWYWTTQEGLADREQKDKAPYQVWVADPAVTLAAVPGPTIDKEFVAAEVQRLVVENEVEFLAADVAGLADFEAACLRIGFPVWRWMGPNKPEGLGLKLVSHAQSTRVVFEDRQLCMPRSVERLEDRVLAGTITVEASPVTTWCASNAVLISDAQKNRAFDKRQSRGRIDGLVTIAMAVGAATMNESVEDTVDASAMIV